MMHTVNSSLSEFNPASEAEIRKLVVQSPSKSCGLDPLLTWLLKDNLDVLVQALVQIVNSSMSLRNVSDSLKEALVTPLLKKNNLDPELLKNLLPVSNLSSKLIERMVASRLNTYMSEHSLHEILQSAYKKHHSIETALLRISDNVLRATDNKKCVLSAAGHVRGVRYSGPFNTPLQIAY